MKPIMNLRAISIVKPIDMMRAIARMKPIRRLRASTEMKPSKFVRAIISMKPTMYLRANEIMKPTNLIYFPLQYTIMGIVSIDQKCRVIIPRSIRDHIGVDAGDKIAFLEKEDGIVMVKIPKDPLIAMSGIFKSDRNKILAVMHELKEEERSDEVHRDASFNV